MKETAFAKRMYQKTPTRQAYLRTKNEIIMGFVVCGALSIQGCALHYYDSQNGTEHLWGFGHMKMKISPQSEGVCAEVKGIETLGLDIGVGKEDYYVGLGWDNRRHIAVSSNAAVRLEWPNGSFFNVRVGTIPPFTTTQK